MGELRSRSIVLGGGAVRGCGHKMGWAHRGCAGSDIGHVRTAILTTLVHWSDGREAKERAQEGGLGDHRHETSEISGRDRGDIERVYSKMQHAARSALPAHRLLIYPENSYISDHSPCINEPSFQNYPRHPIVDNPHTPSTQHHNYKTRGTHNRQSHPHLA